MIGKSDASSLARRQLRAAIGAADEHHSADGGPPRSGAAGAPPASARDQAAAAEGDHLDTRRVVPSAVGATARAADPRRFFSGSTLKVAWSKPSTASNWSSARAREEVATLLRAGRARRNCRPVFENVPCTSSNSRAGLSVGSDCGRARAVGNHMPRAGIRRLDRD